MTRCEHCGGQVIVPDFDGACCLQCGRSSRAALEPLELKEKYLDLDKWIEREARIIAAVEERRRVRLGLERVLA